jgi:17beta-estradiol 17-dehydrogenase / very-long-chain 3-oxoacyl-CoA reductase
MALDPKIMELIPLCCTALVALCVSRHLLGAVHAIYAHMLRSGKNLKKAGNWGIVTGATDGIGQAIAFELARKGLNVLLLSRTESKLAATAKEILAKYPSVQVDYIAIDFSDFNSAAQKKVSDNIKDKEIAVLVNNVGMSYPFAKYYDELKLEEVDAMTELNMNSTSRMTYLVLPNMLERKRGYIVNMSSGSAWNACPLLSQYAATKSYVEQFTASMHEEYSSKGIHFQVQSPLFVSTKLAKIRNASLTVPSPKKFAQTSVAHIGYEVSVSPYWAHALQLHVMSKLPTFVVNKIVMSMHLGIRKKGRAKEAKAGKAN